MPRSTTFRASHRDNPSKSGAVRTSAGFILSNTMSQSVTNCVDDIRMGVNTSSASRATIITKPDNRPTWVVGTNFENASTEKPAASASET